MTVKFDTTKLTPRQREGRAINAVAELLRLRLSVPNIYIEPPTSVIAADILAVDRAGAGDLHAVEVKMTQPWPGPSTKSRGRTAEATLLQVVHRQLMGLPAHYRYLAVSAEKLKFVGDGLVGLGLFSEDGIGRIGLIAIKEPDSESPIAEIAVAPERFRVGPEKLQGIEKKLLAKSRPDIEVRV